MTGAKTWPIPRIARRLGDGTRQNASDRRSQVLGIVHHASEARQSLNLAAEQQGP
jgi:hypothetical protein